MILDAIAFLNQYSNLIMAIMSSLLVLITFAYVVFTWRMVKEMQITREADLRPYIIVDILLSGRMFNLIIKNNGKTAAQKVRFSIDKNVETVWKRKLNELLIFREGVSFFSPGKEFVISLGPDTLFFAKDAEVTKYPKDFAIITEYTYFDKIKATETTTINLEEYLYTRPYPSELVKSIENLGSAIRAGLNSIAKSTEKMSKIEEISSPTGLDISQGTLYRIVETIRGGGEEKIRFDLNLTTLMEFVELLGIESKTAEKILEKRYSKGYFESFDDLKDIDSMTEELLDKLKRQTFICNPHF